MPYGLNLSEAAKFVDAHKTSSLFIPHSYKIQNGYDIGLTYEKSLTYLWQLAGEPDKTSHF